MRIVRLSGVHGYARVRNSPRMCEVNLDGLRFLTQTGIAQVAEWGAVLTELTIDGADLADEARGRARQNKASVGHLLECVGSSTRAEGPRGGCVARAGGQTASN